MKTSFPTKRNKSGNLIIHAKPVKPRVTHLDFNYHIISFLTSLSELEKWAKENKLNTSDIKFECNCDDYLGDELIATGNRKETDEEFQIRFDEYNVALKNYTEWYNKNKKEIIKINKEKKEKATNTKLSKLKKEKEKLERQIKKCLK